MNTAVILYCGGCCCCGCCCCGSCGVVTCCCWAERIFCNCSNNCCGVFTPGVGGGVVPAGGTSGCGCGISASGSLAASSMVVVIGDGGGAATPARVAGVRI